MAALRGFDGNVGSTNVFVAMLRTERLNALEKLIGGSGVVQAEDQNRGEFGNYGEVRGGGEVSKERGVELESGWERIGALKDDGVEVGE